MSIQIEIEELRARLDELEQQVIASSGGGSGSGLTYFEESKTTASPNNTVPANSLVVIGAETDIDLVLSPKGYGSLIAQTPNNLTSGGNKRGIYAVDFQLTRSINDQVASGINSTIAGGVSNRANGNYSTVAGGVGNDGAGAFTTIGGGGYNYAGVQIGTIPGGSNAWTKNISGQFAYAAGSFTDIYSRGPLSPNNYSVGTAQWGVLILRRETTNNTANLVLTSNGSTGVGATNTTYVYPNMSIAFNGLLIARQYGFSSSLTGSASWEFKGAAKKGATDSTIAFIGTPTITLLGADADASTWTASLGINTTNGTVEVRVTGESSKTIHWCAIMQTVEVC
jgi:hypothetical protein